MSTIGEMVFVDLDETLIDTRYQITDGRIFTAVAMAQATGWQIGLSSDTPYEALRLWRERFDMNGPIIAERGAVVEIDGMPNIDATTARAFSDARSAVAERFTRQNISIWSGNPVEALRTGLHIGRAGDRVVLINKLSQASLRFFARTVNQLGELAVDHQLTVELATQARTLYPNFADVTEEINPEYGIVIVSRSSNTKEDGTRRFMAAMGQSEAPEAIDQPQVRMIGNSMGDYLGNIARHYAVSNATPEFQSVADYVAKGPITTGVVEILDKLRLGQLS